MSDLKITPGTWKSEPDSISKDGWNVVTNSGYGSLVWYVAACWPKADGADTEANARLIAAAPELYEVASALVASRIMDAEGKPKAWALSELDAAVTAARAALRKARGES